MAVRPDPKRVIVVSRTAASVFHPPRMAIDTIFSAACLAALVAIWRRTKYGIFDPYRPELHYMRGPGPKWCERHGLVFPASEAAIARVRRQS
jgi:hypothetical protein